MNSKTFGRIGESIAEDFVRKKRYKIIGMNYNTGGGELDIVALDGKTLVFIEVKTAATLEYGLPGRKLTPHKMACLRRAAAEFVSLDGQRGRVPYYIKGKYRITLPYKDKRFDLLEIIAKNGAVMRITHTKNVFKMENDYALQQYKRYR